MILLAALFIVWTITNATPNAATQAPNAAASEESLDKKRQTAFETADTARLTTAVWNGIRVRCSTQEGIARIDPLPDRCLVQMDLGNDAGHTVVIKSDELLLSSGVLGLNDRRWEVGLCREIKIAGARDRLAVTVVEQHSASSSSGSSHSRSANGVSNSTSSSSTSTSVSTDVKSLEIVTWNDKRIELSLEGGNSVESSIDGTGKVCRLEFEIDEGKNKRTILLEPRAVQVDRTPLDIDVEYSEIGIEATRKSLSVMVDGDVIASWKDGRRYR
jgi:hypothetical protein